MSGYDELVERLKPRFVIDEPVGQAIMLLGFKSEWAEAVKALKRFLIDNNALKTEAATAIATLQGERDEAREHHHNFVDANALDIAALVTRAETAEAALADVAEVLSMIADGEEANPAILAQITLDKLPRSRMEPGKRQPIEGREVGE